jgi:hypothetical protein
MRQSIRLTPFLVAAAITSGCGGDSDPGERSGPLVDERAGTFRGVSLGDRPNAVALARGRPDQDPGTRNATPTGASDETSRTFGGMQPPSRRATLRIYNYRDATYLATREDGVYAILITAAGARTSRGVAIGDSLQDIRQRYSGFECGVKNADNEYVDVPYCGGRVGRARHIWFGGDPVASITLAVSPMVGTE